MEIDDAEKPISAIGRLLEELSWVGATIKNYRKGGRGYENVLTAEALQALDFLPRDHFFGALLQQCTGADSARQMLVQSIERATFTLLPGNFYLRPTEPTHQRALAVQPDGVICSETVYALIEAKRIKPSSFQPQQLAREYLLTVRDAKERTPLLLLLLGKEPPVSIQKHGKQDIRSAVLLHLRDVYNSSEKIPWSFAEAAERIDEVICWTTWNSISTSVTQSLSSFDCKDPSLRATVHRLAKSTMDAVEWHRR